MGSGLLSRPPEEGARLLALAFLDQAAEARPRLSDPADAEGLHDFRVGLRRLRSCLKAYAAWLDVPKKLARRLKRLAGATGPGRDTEVQIEWLRGRSAHLSVYRAEIHLDARAPRSTLAEATAGLLRRQVEDLENRLARIEDAGSVEEAHQARIRAKRVRYLLEPLTEEIPEAAPVVKRFKALQDLLGEFHDAHVLEAELVEAVGGRILELSLADAPDANLLRAERRRARESGLIALARLNRARRDRLFETLDADWLDGKAGDFLREVEGLL
jgi:CHAD domain-containing protein